MIYNQKEHEKWKKHFETHQEDCLVVADFNYKRYAFVKGFDHYVPD